MAENTGQFQETANEIESGKTEPGENGAEEKEVAEPSTSNSLADQAWLTSLWRPLLISILAACLVVALLAFIRRLVPGLPAGYTQLVIGIGLLTAAIGCASTTWLAQPAQRGHRHTGYRAAELVLILLITRIAVWAATGAWPGFDLVLRPLESLLDGYFLVGLFAVLLAWFMATTMTEDMIGMALRPDDIYLSRTSSTSRDKWQDTARPVYTDRPAILRRFTGRWVAGGILLVVMAAGSRFAPPQSGFFLPIIGQNIDRTVIIAVIVYFLVGLVLISQGQLALLRARWTLQKTPSSPSVLHNWPIYALFLILAVGFIAALMPLGGTFRLALILSAVFEFTYRALVEIFGFILGLFLFLASLFTGEQPEQAVPPSAPPPVFTPEPVPEPPMELPPWTGGTLFWIAAALLLGYAAYIYFSGKGFNFAWLHQLWQMLRVRWRQMVGAYQEWQATHVRSTDDGDNAPSARRRRRLLGWLGFRGLDPDSQVRYYYLSLLEQAEQAGHARRSSETPTRYAPRLAEEVAEDEADRDAVHTLTEAFVRVRYADGHFEPEDAVRLRGLWNQLKRLLRL